MSRLISMARVVAPDARKLVVAMRDLVAAHEATVIHENGRYLGDFHFGAGAWWPEDDHVVMTAEAADMAALNGVKLELGGSLSYVSQRPLDIVWSGGASGLTELPKFVLLTVASAVPLTPHMKRIVFAGANLSRFASTANLHVKLAIPQGAAPQWPKTNGQGRLVWPEGASRPAIRKYTIRTVDLSRGTVTIDFALHDDAGPGARFAAEAAPGDVIGMIGPGGLSVAAAEWYLLAGDETALPAIARILELLPAAARGVALMEVDAATDQLPLQKPDGVQLIWLHRHGAAPGSTPLLADAVRNIAFPAGGSPVFAWAGCEFDAAQAIRRHLKQVVHLKKDQHLIVSYWRRGVSEEQMEEARHRRS